MIGLLAPNRDNFILASYFAVPTSNTIGDDRFNLVDHPEDFQFASRSLRQLECPTVANRTCEGVTTYIGWDDAVWDLGDNQTLPDLRSNRRPADVQGRLF